MSEIAEIIKAETIWFGYANDYDCMTADSMDDSTRRTLRNNFGIPIDEEILFARDTSFWNDKNQGAVITDGGIYALPDNDNPENRFTIEWKEFNQVFYQDLIFYFFDDDTQVASLHYDILLKCDDDDVADIAPLVCDMLTDAAAAAPVDVNPLELANNGQFEQAIEAADSLIAANPESSYPYLCKGRAIYLEQCAASGVDSTRVEEAIDIMRQANRYTEANSDEESVVYRNIGFLYQLLGESYNARDNFVLALESTEEPRDVMRLIHDTERDLSDLWATYTDYYDYNDRKFCMVVRDSELGGCIVPNINIFRQSNVPSAMTFPVGHPYPNQLYIGHPYIKSLYVPYEESEERFFMDKVHELCHLLMCLGAEQIEITSEKGKDVSELQSYASTMEGSADVKLFSASAQINNSGRTHAESSDKLSRSITINLDPMNQPFVPEGLVWFNEQPEWKRLAENRLKNNILEYSERVESSQTRFTNATELSEIKVQAQYLWTKVSANVENNSESQFKTQTDTVWNIKVKFRSLKHFANAPYSDSQRQATLTADEQEYLEEVKCCLEEDGVISPKEQKMLDRMRLRLGISESRAQELSNMLRPLNTPEELQLIEEIKACLDDGEISEKEIRMLNRMADRLGISSERCATLINQNQSDNKGGFFSGIFNMFKG